MHKARIVFIFGVWVAILPYLGFPLSMKSILFSLTGIALACFAYLFYKEDREKGTVEEKVFDNFSENKNFTE